MDPIRKIPKKVTKKFVSKVINRQYFHRKTGLYSLLQFGINSQQVLRAYCPTIYILLPLL